CSRVAAASCAAAYSISSSDSIPRSVGVRMRKSRIRLSENQTGRGANRSIQLAAQQFNCLPVSRDQGLLGPIVVSALGTAGFSFDAISEVQRHFGDKEKPRLSARATARFARSRHAAANRRYSNSALIFGRNDFSKPWGKSQFEFGETSKTCAVPWRD